MWWDFCFLGEVECPEDSKEVLEGIEERAGVKAEGFVVKRS